jgi:hypothetical protein
MNERQGAFGVHEDRIEIRETLETALKRTGRTAIPPSVAAVTERHVGRLARLVRDLRAAGIDETVIRRGTQELLASYETELIAALMAVNEKGEA